MRRREQLKKSKIIKITSISFSPHIILFFFFIKLSWMIHYWEWWQIDFWNSAIIKINCLYLLAAYCKNEWDKMKRLYLYIKHIHFYDILVLCFITNNTHFQYWCTRKIEILSFLCENHISHRSIDKKVCFLFETYFHAL